MCALTVCLSRSHSHPPPLMGMLPIHALPFARNAIKNAFTASAFLRSKGKGWVESERKRDRESRREKMISPSLCEMCNACVDSSLKFFLVPWGTFGFIKVCKMHYGIWVKIFFTFNSWRGWNDRKISNFSSKKSG